MDPVARVLVLLPSATYRAGDFLAAARLEVDVVVGSEERQTLADSIGDRALVVPLADVAAATEAIAELHARTPLDAVVADELSREEAAADVMMIPIPRAGVLEAGRRPERGADVVGLEITIAPGRPLLPLPEGDRYLGFVFAHAETPAAVEQALRAAYGMLQIVIVSS
jgi:hypothetical protein